MIIDLYHLYKLVISNDYVYTYNLPCSLYISTKYVSHSSLETLSEVLLKVKQTIFKLREQRINDKRNRKFKKNLKKNREPLNSSTNNVQMISLLSHTQKSKVGGNHAPFPVKCFFSSFTVINTTTSKVVAFEYTAFMILGLNESIPCMNRKIHLSILLLPNPCFLAYKATKLIHQRPNHKERSQSRETSTARSLWD